MSAPVAAPGRNVWRVERAERFAVLVDADAYFAALLASLRCATRSVFILGWDLHSGLRLRPEDEDGPELRALLSELAAERPGLRIRLLDWDYSMLLASERELLPWLALDARTPSRVRFRLDGRHPVGACHHQKIVVIDDRMAFVGGLDLTSARWDTPEHRIDDPRRATVDGKPYPPFHDVQAAFDGEAARVVGMLARERWARALGRRAIPRGVRPESGVDPWPAMLEPDLRNVEVGIARTEPAYDGRSEIREVEALYQDSIRAARRYVYLENQYLTSRVVGEALCESLARRDGPEILAVAPRECSGWLEEGSMGLLRHRLVQRIQAADVHGRFRLLYPRLPSDAVRLNVHSKVMIADDALLRVGSANLSNRSMGFDTECDVVVESRAPEDAAGIARVLHRLLGEHLGEPAEAVEKALHESGGRLFATIDRLSAGERRLEKLDATVSAWVDRVFPEELPTDPERPMEAFRELEAWTPELLRDPHRRRLLPILAGLGALLAIAVGWQLAGLDAATLRAFVERFSESPLAPLLVVGIFVGASLVVFPVTPLVIATVLAFEGLYGAALALVGCLSAATVTYAIGRFSVPGSVARLLRGRGERVRARLEAASLASLTAVRLVPVAPFTVVNVIAGASRVRFPVYVAATALGMAPGIAVTALAGGSIRSGNGYLLAALAVAAGLGGVAWLLRSRLRRPARATG